MDERQFQDRTKALALRVVRMVAALPPGVTPDVIGRQVLRSATSVAANYRAACRASGRRRAMAAKLDIALEEADETLFWIEMLMDAEILPAQRLSDLHREANEITAMLVASLRTLRKQSLTRPSPSRHSTRLSDYLII
jgi:four helix bundle protein